MSANSKRPRAWPDRLLNSTHSLINPEPAWPAFFLPKENLMRLKLRGAWAWSYSRPPQAAVGGRCLWQFSAAMARRHCAKLNWNLTKAIDVLNSHSRNIRVGIAL